MLKNEPLYYLSYQKNTGIISGYLFFSPHCLKEKSRNDCVCLCFHIHDLLTAVFQDGGVEVYRTQDLLIIYLRSCQLKQLVKDLHTAIYT